MYDIPYFKTENPGEVMAYMKAHPFAIICGVDSEHKPVATQVPILFSEREGKLFLQGHFMKKQDHTNAFYNNPDALVLFTGAHTYVSASWYTDQKTASTWNYQSVQASGILRFQEEDFLLQLLTRLTEQYEHPGSPSLVQEMDGAYVKKMMQAIVAFEIEVISVRHIFKLSQNRDKQSYANIVAKLDELGPDAREIARAMSEKIKTNL